MLRWKAFWLANCLALAGSSFFSGTLATAQQDTAAPVRDDRRVTRTVEIIRDIEQGVVAIFSQGGDRTMHSGSGSIIHPAGFVLTNDHVVHDRPGVVLRNGQRPVRYQTIGRIPEKDLAIVRIPPRSDLTVIPVGHSDDLMTGEPCLCGGNPGGRGIIFTSGMISSPAIMKDAPNALVMSQFTHDRRDRFIQFDAASNPGNSGGPLINANGQQIGVVSAKVLHEENISYAIPIDRIREHAAELIAPEASRDLFAGIEVDARQATAEVMNVVPDSPAATAGIQAGDVLTRVNGTALRDGLNWLLHLATCAAGDTVTLTYRRGDKTDTVSFALDAYPTRPATTIDASQPGLRWELFVEGPLGLLPEFSQLEPVASGVSSQLQTRELSGERKENFALRFDGFVKLETSGFHRLILASDDGSQLFLHDQLLIDNGGAHPRQELGAKVRLEAGLHPLRIEYFEATGDATLELFLEQADGTRVKLGEGDFYHTPEPPNATSD